MIGSNGSQYGYCTSLMAAALFSAAFLFVRVKNLIAIFC